MPPWDDHCHTYHRRHKWPYACTDVSIRHNSSLTEQITSLLPPTPPYLADATIWGATGLLLTNFHLYLHLPYWACISLTNVSIRAAMIPIAIRGAKTQIKFGNISPEVQYLISNFTNDMKALRARGAWSGEGSFSKRQSEQGQFRVIYSTVSSLRGLFKLNGVNLFDIFKVRTYHMHKRSVHIIFMCTKRSGIACCILLRQTN